MQATIDHVKSHIPDAVTQYVTNLNTTLTSSKSTVKTNVQQYIDDMYKCMMDETGQGSDCDTFNESSTTALKSLLNQSNAYTRKEFLSYMTKTNGDYVNSLEKEASQLKDEISRIRFLLTEASPSIDSLSSHISVANITNEYKNDQWLQFEYDSKSSSSSQDDSHSFSSSSSSGGVDGFFFGSSSSSYSQTEERDHEYKLSKSDMKVKGELLRVNIKRPWFRPEIFHEPGLTYVSTEYVYIYINTYIGR